MGGAARRGPGGNNDAPGPGSYDYNDGPTGGAKWGKEARNKGHINDAPGPGQYSSPDFIGRDGKGQGKSFGVRYKDGKLNDAPGPGAYDSRIDGAKDKAPAFSMGGRHNPRGGDANPGPGNYDPDINKVREKAPGFGMGKGGRGGGKINDAPGPGNYYLPEKKGGGITMGARMNQ